MNASENNRSRPRAGRRLVVPVAALLLVFSSVAGGEEPIPGKSAGIFQLPPVSDEAVQSLADHLLVHMTHGMGYTAIASSGALFGPEDNLEHVKVYRKPGVAGAVMIALRPVSAGKLLIIKASNDDEQLFQDVKAISKVAAEQVGILKSRAIADILANAKVMDFPLGYIRVDRALGALKMMGYNVIEMTEAAGVGKNKVYTLASVTDYRLPMITAFVDSDNTSLVEAKARAGSMGSLTPSLGGSSLASVTDSSAQQRLLIAYDPAAPDSLAGLMDDLQEVIDVPAHQILIEGMIVEVSQDKLRELGVDFSVTDHRVTYSHESEVVGGTSTKPVTVGYNDFVLAPEGFEARLRLLVENGSADILSKPSILALNNHQARIRIGREMPISTTVATAATTTIDISYFFMGIVLNIKPRISRDQKEVSMQVEAIVSSRAPVKPLTHIVNGEELEVAPVIDSRIVQTFARVSNNTPFIIGGLIAHDVRKTVSGIPLLMDIPLLGWLFRTTTTKIVKNEVIVVLTPRVVPRKSESHFAVIPKDSESFEFLSDSKLFRNTYRIRQEDKFDLSFIYSNPRYKRLAGLAAQRANEDRAFANNPTVQSILDDHIPGERALMLRMLYEVVKRVENKIAGKKDQTHVDRLPTHNIILFQPRRQEGKDFEEVKVKRLTTELKEMEKEAGRALIIHYDLAAVADQEQVMPPLNISIIEALKRSDCKNTMYELNVMKNDGTFESTAIVIGTPQDLGRLKTCLILKKLLEINNFPEALRVSDFPVGMQILYPNLEDDTRHDPRMHVVDPNVAKLFYISDYYYKAFQQVYQAELDKLEEMLEEE